MNCLLYNVDRDDVHYYAIWPLVTRDVQLNVDVKFSLVLATNHDFYICLLSWNESDI